MRRFLALAVGLAAASLAAWAWAGRQWERESATPTVPRWVWDPECYPDSE